MYIWYCATSHPSQIKSAVSSHLAWQLFLSGCQLMHQQLPKSGAREGRTGSKCQGHEWNTLCAIYPLLPLRHLDSAPNSALSTTMPYMQLTLSPFSYLTTTAAIPVTYSYGSLKPETFQTVLLSPFLALLPWTKARLLSVDVKISRYS